MDRSAIDAEQLSAALLTIEDEILWDAAAELRNAVAYEQRADELGDDLLVARARLCVANMLMRSGDVPGAAHRIWAIHRWAVEHRATRLQARVHLVWAGIHRHLGDAAQSLEHALLAVELLDDTATAHMRVWHQAKLADALGYAGSIEAARLRYAQTEDLALRLDQPRLLVCMLNNYAATESAAGHHQRAQEVVGRLQEHAIRYGFELDPAALDTIGAIAVENGRYGDAERTMRICIERHGEGRHEDADALAEYLLTLARSERGLGALDRAQASLDASRALCVQRELSEVLVRVHREQSELHAARGDYAAAFAAHKVFFAAHHNLHSAQREAQARTRQAMFETNQARQEAERFREQARRDPLTGLHNRRYLEERMPALLAAEGPLTVAIVDVDHFKSINDRLSHDVGDQVLVRVAKLLEAELATGSAGAFVVRMGGEEFLIVLPGVDVPAAAARLDDLRRAVRSYGWAELTSDAPVTVSIGVAGSCDAPARTQSNLISIADRNLYVAKRAGRDRVVAGAGRARSQRDPAPTG